MVNSLLQTITAAVRTENTRIRGIMSQDYTKFDDDVFMEMVGKAIGSESDHQILMYHRDERGMHLRIGFPDLQSAVGKLDNGHPDNHMVGIHINIVLNIDSAAEQEKIRTIIALIDLKNGDVTDFLSHLAEAYIKTHY